MMALAGLDLDLSHRYVMSADSNEKDPFRLTRMLIKKAMEASGTIEEES